MKKTKLLKLDKNPPFKMIIDIYKDEEDIPDELIKVLYNKPNYQPYTIICGSKGFKEFDKAIKEYSKIKINNGK